MIPIELTAARSAVLDAFAELEHEVAEALKISSDCAAYEGAPLGQKLKQLEGLKAGPLLSKANQKIITDAVSKAYALCEIRNDIVHSRMRLVVGNLDTAVYINTRTVDNTYPLARVMTVNQHLMLASAIDAITLIICSWRCMPKR